jgi:tRNA-dihydrouridine synthase B
MKLGSVALGTVFLAPLSGVADSPFRRICKRFGAEVVYSEMVSSEGLSRRNRRSTEVARFSEDERPIGIQIFGRDPRRMAESARIVEDLGPDFIDLNFACPARKIVSRGAGCALMREPGSIARIASAVVGATALPVTAKIRIGWDDASINALEVAKKLEEEGVAALGVHGRTGKQGFRDTSSWSEVARVKRGTAIPVILSGDVTSPEVAERAFAETGCDAVMIGRAVYGRPWIFRELRAYFSGGTYHEPRSEERRQTILAHLDLAITEYGERVAVVRFRKHLLWYTKGMRGVVAWRPAMSRMTMRQDVVDLLETLTADEPQKGVESG